MSGPVGGFKFIHEAIRRESAALARQAWALGPETDVAPIVDKTSWFAHVVHLHTGGEEVGLFPAEERAPHLAGLFVMDHREETDRFEALIGSLRELRDPARGDAHELRRRAIGDAAALAAHASLHSRKEDQLLVPLVDALFSAAEQQAMVGRMLSQFQPADMARILPWLVGWLDPEDRIAYLRLMREAVPSDRFDGVVRAVSAGVSAEVWDPIAAALAR